MSSQIRWRDWSAEAFAEARRDDKPILLSIGAVWCHWCHVMDRTSYADAEVAAAIERSYVPVRVDTDQRPDVNARYNLGGWPTTALLTPDGEVLSGATYVPPKELRALLDEVSTAYRTHRDAIGAELGERARRMRERHPPDRDALDATILGTTRDAIVASYDSEYGGFGSAPKFPQPAALDFLLLLHESAADPQIEAIVSKTLVAMARGGMYDHVEGGFFRYSTTRDWTVPHFEKMADDHAALLPLYARGWKRLGIASLRETLLATLRYVRAVLRDPETNFFAGSQDADEAYYALPPEERQSRPSPFVDRTVFTSLNASLAGAFVRAARVLEDDGLAAEAVATLDALEMQMRDERGLYFHFRCPGARPELQNLLGDQVAVLRALLDAHEQTGESRFRTRASQLAERICEVFTDSDGTLVDHANPEGFGRMSRRDHPLDENALAADSLLRLAVMTGDAQPDQRARGILEAFSRSYAAARSFAAPYASAVARALYGGAGVAIAGDGGEALREAAFGLPDPFLTVATFAAGDATLARRGLRSSDGRALAFVCRGSVCAAPVAEAAAVRAAFDALGA